MCSYIGIKVSKKQYVKLKNLEKELGTVVPLKAVQSGFEYTDWEIVVAKENDIQILKAHWEFIPNHIKTNHALVLARKQGIPWLNAKAETLLSSKMFADAAKNRRCLVPVSWFFEWKHQKPAGSKKNHIYPHIITVNDVDLFYLAGIWQPWVDTVTGISINTFAIITTAANTLMAEIHNTKKRMPTILPTALAEEWLNNNLKEDRIQQIAAHQIPSNKLNATTIAQDFRTQLNPTIPFIYNELKGLFD